MTFRQIYRIGKRILIGLWSVVFIAVAILGIAEGGQWAFRPLKLLFVMAVVWAIPLLIWEFLERKNFPELGGDEEETAENDPLETHSAD